jgi:hypothetical protein
VFVVEGDAAAVEDRAKVNWRAEKVVPGGVDNKVGESERAVLAAIERHEEMRARRKRRGSSLPVPVETTPGVEEVAA